MQNMIKRFCVTYSENSWSRYNLGDNHTIRQIYYSSRHFHMNNWRCICIHSNHQDKLKVKVILYMILVVYSCNCCRQQHCRKIQRYKSNNYIKQYRSTYLFHIEFQRTRESKYRNHFGNDRSPNFYTMDKFRCNALHSDPMDRLQIYKEMNQSKTTTKTKLW